MAGIDEINIVKPTWQIDKKKERDAKDEKKKSQKEPPRKNDEDPDDGRPHIDEYV